MAIEKGEVVKQFGESLLQDLKDNTPGSVKEELTMETTESGFTISGPSWIGVFEKGRGPTKAGATKGSPTLQESILDWIEGHGITGRPNEKGKVPTSNQLSWAISNSIHQHGNKLFQSLNGGKTDYFDSVFSSERIDAFLKVFGDGYNDFISSEIIDDFKKK